MATEKLPPHVTIRKARKLWFKRGGLPREVALYSIEDVHNALRIAFSKNPAEVVYQKHVAHAVVSHLRRECSRSHISWTDWPDPKGAVKSGFTNDPDKVAASVQYIEGRKKAYITATNQQLTAQKDDLKQLEKLA